MIHPGRAFTRCMYTKFSNVINTKQVDAEVSELGSGRNSLTLCSGQGKLKLHHHVSLDEEFRSDCKMWLSFLESGNMAVCRLFIGLSVSVRAEQLFFYTDSSANQSLRLGAVYNKAWFYGQWEERFIQKCSPSIAYLELFAVCAAIYTWADQLGNLRCILFCDNKGVVEMLNNTSSKCPHCMRLIRKITLKGLQINSRFFARYVETKQNFFADSLSQLQLK